jgi:hypothetical protein
MTETTTRALLPLHRSMDGVQWDNAPGRKNLA